MHQVSCGPHHAALLTNRLELYTWGSNEYGALGNGSLFGRSAPSQLTQMTGQVSLDYVGLLYKDNSLCSISFIVALVHAA